MQLEIGDSMKNMRKSINSKFVSLGCGTIDTDYSTFDLIYIFVNEMKTADFERKFIEKFAFDLQILFYTFRFNEMKWT